MALLLVLAGCSGSVASSEFDQESASSTTISEATSSDDTVSESTVPEGSVPQSAVPTSPAPPPTASPASIPPAQPFDEEAAVAENDEPNDDAWISRRSMTATSIEVVWSAPAGAADYQVHRVELLDDDRPPAASLDSSNQIHSGDETGVYLDADVVAGTRYWYGVRGLDAQGEVLSVGWHEAHAITDEEPPSAVGLSLANDDGTIRLDWSAPAENYQLHGYRILRSVDGTEPEVVATTWNLDQTSFIDEEPPKGSVTYQVQAFDFHWNSSTPAQQTVSIP